MYMYLNMCVMNSACGCAHVNLFVENQKKMARGTFFQRLIGRKQWDFEKKEAEDRAEEERIEAIQRRNAERVAKQKAEKEKNDTA